VPEERLRGYQSDVSNGAILMTVDAKSASDAQAIARDWAEFGGKDIHRSP